MLESLIPTFFSYHQFLGKNEIPEGASGIFEYSAAVCFWGASPSCESKSLGDPRTVRMPPRTHAERLYTLVRAEGACEKRRGWWQKDCLTGEYLCAHP